MKIAVSYQGLKKYGIYLGDAITCLMVLYEIIKTHPNATTYLLVHPNGEFNFLFDYTILRFNVRVIQVTTNTYDERRRIENEIARTKMFRGIQFDKYFELYPRLEGGPRQGFLCGYEKGLGRQGVIEYYYYGQQDPPELDYVMQSVFELYHVNVPKEKDIFYVPFEKCQGNSIFTLSFHELLIGTLIDKGYSITINAPNNQYRMFANCCDISYLEKHEFAQEVKKHRLVIAGNTGVGWFALLLGVPLLAFEYRYQNLRDYNFFRHPNSSLYAYLEKPDVDMASFFVDQFFAIDKQNLAV